jgi:hypothetical protein
MSRLRAGEGLAALGGAGLFVLLFFDWFAVQKHHLGWSAYAPDGNARGLIPAHLSGWSTLGWFMVALLCVQMLGAAALFYMTVKRASPAWPVGAGVLTWLLGSLIWLVLLVRVCVTQPGYDAWLGVQLPAYLGLLFSALIPLGAFLSIRDERTHSAEAQAYMPPPARTAPGL